MLKLLYARNVRRGMALCFGKEYATVSAVELMDGSNGENPMLIGGDRKTAVGIKIHFENRAPIIAHPGDEVAL